MARSETRGGGEAPGGALQWAEELGPVNKLGIKKIVTVCSGGKALTPHRG